MVCLPAHIAGIVLLVVGLGLHIFSMASPNWIIFSFSASSVAGIDDIVSLMKNSARPVAGIDDIVSLMKNGASSVAGIDDIVSLMKNGIIDGLFLLTNRGLFGHCYNSGCFSFFNERAADWTVIKVMSIIVALCCLVSCCMSLIFAFYKRKSPKALEETVFGSLRLKTLLVLGVSVPACAAAAFILIMCTIFMAKIMPQEAAIARTKQVLVFLVTDVHTGYAMHASFSACVMLFMGCGVFLGEAGKVHYTRGIRSNEKVQFT